jgi:RNA polymerase sigma factor (sigma-70 family)
MNTSNETTAAEFSAPATSAINIDQLYREHHKHVKFFVMRYVRNNEDAEDVTQATFMEASRCAGGFSGMSKPSTWLFGIALNMARSHVRQRLSREDTLDINDFDETLPAANADPARLCEARDLLRKSLAVLSNMSQDMQDTFGAVIESGMTYELAAHSLDIPVGTVRSRLARIRGQIRDLKPE